MQSGRKLILIIVATLTLMDLPGCGARSSETGETPLPNTQAEPANPFPPVDSGQAGAAIADAMLSASTALYLALIQGAENNTAALDDGSLTLTWSDDADFATGIGTYEIGLTGFKAGANSEFGAEIASGYVLTGFITLQSPDGNHSTLTMDLTSSHADPVAFPVQRIELEIDGYTGEPETPGGYVRINGREISFADIAGPLSAFSATR
jgi:hypothetical protein